MPRSADRVLEIGGRRLPFLRWSFVRMILGIGKLTKEWQVGDGREAALADYVEANAKPGDLDDAIRVVDEFCYRHSFMMNVGDEKGEILDRAIERANPELVLELGTYCGYSGLRMVRAMPAGGRLLSVEFHPDNAAIARRIWAHAGVADRATVVVGTLGDGGRTATALEAEHGVTPGSVGAVFIDHAKDAYVPDLELIVARDWLRDGAVVVADNIKFPGAPDYLELMRAAEGRAWRTTEHPTHAEYQTLIKDLVLESEYHPGDV
jgi:catechol O-methyltransferase